MSNRIKNKETNKDWTQVKPTSKIDKADINIEEINELIEEIDLCLGLLGYEKEILKGIEEVNKIDNVRED